MFQFDNLIGEDGVKISVGVDMLSVTYLLVGAILAGTILILISKKLIK